MTVLGSKKLTINETGDYFATGSQINRILVSYLGSQYASNNVNFWSAVNLQGAYLEQSNITSYATIVDITGGGILSCVLPGTTSGGGAKPIFIEITVDSVVREFKVVEYQGIRPILAFFPREFIGTDLQSINPNAQFNGTYTTSYGNPLFLGSGWPNLYLQPASNSGGLRFEQNLKVRIKCATALYANSYRDRSGVLYATDT